MTTVKRCLALAGIGLLGGVGAVGLVVCLLHPVSPDVKKAPTNGPLNTERFASDSQHNLAVRAEIEEKGPAFWDEAGVHTCLGPEYTPESPLVEIIPRMRDLDGKIKPFPVETLLIYLAEGGQPGYCCVEGTGYRLQIDSRALTVGNFWYDQEYRVIARYWLAEDQLRIYADSSEATFRTPAHLDAGEIYRVELLLMDKRTEWIDKEVAKQRAEEEKRIAEEGAIRISATYPDDHNDVLWKALYQGEHSGREVCDDEGSGQIVIADTIPVPLGGELTIFYMDKKTGLHWNWCYLGNVQKRTLHFPDDADFVVVEEDSVPITFDLTNRDAAVAAGIKALFLYFSSESQRPLFVVPLSSSEQTAGTDASSAIEVLLPPGTFHVRAILEGDEQIPLGTVTITSEIDKVYAFEFPTDWTTRED